MFIARQSHCRQGGGMPPGLFVAIALSAQAAGGAAATEVPAAPVHIAGETAATAPGERCRTPPPTADATEIIVCAERPQGYRLNPDVSAAKKGSRGGQQNPPTAHMKDTTCTVVGTMPCPGAATINLLGAALTAVEMASRLSRGENVGSMFVTRPEASEYELYVAAKRQREAAEAEAAAALKSAAKTAAKAAATAEAAPRP
jgi:hypothetical protein